MENAIHKGLEHEFLFEQEYVEDVACMDEVDQAILGAALRWITWHIAKRCSL